MYSDLIKYLTPSSSIIKDIIILVIFLVIIYLLVFRRVQKNKSGWSLNDNLFSPENDIVARRINTRYGIMISDIQLRRRLEKQMDNFEEKKQDEIVEEFLRIHRHRLQKVGVSPIESDSHPQVQILKLVIKLAFDDRSRGARRAIRRHFKNMVDEFPVKTLSSREINKHKKELPKYIKECIEEIVPIIRSNVSNGWVENKNIVIDRRESWNECQLQLNNKDSKIIELAYSAYVEAFDIYIDTCREIKKLEKENDDYVKELRKNHD